MVAQMIEEIGILFPRCPPKEAAAIAAHTAARGNGRVGRTAAGRNLEERAHAAAVTAAVRHGHTEYDALLAAGVERDLARQRVAPVRCRRFWRLGENRAIQKLCIALSIRLLVSD